MSPSSLRDRLEGRADLLDAAALRYRALRVALRGVFWRARLRRNAEVLRATAEAQAEVEEVLASALRRADAEGWPGDDPWVQQLFALKAQKEELARLCARRLRAKQEPPLGEALSALEALLAGPRKILPGQRWATALEILPRSLPELRGLARHAEFVEELFHRPFEPGAALPLTPEEARALAERLPQAEAALELVWQRVERCDPSLGLLRFLQRRARRAPIGEPHNGPEQLLRAAFWLETARARLTIVMHERFDPLTITPAEQLQVFEWVVARERALQAAWFRGTPAGAAADAVLLAPGEVAPPASLGPGRAALLELAHELWRMPREVAAVRPPPRPAPGGHGVTGERLKPPAPSERSRERMERLLELARRADAAPASPDAERLRDQLSMLVRIREAASDHRLEGPEVEQLKKMLEELRRNMPVLVEGLPPPEVPPDRTFAALIARAW